MLTNLTLSDLIALCDYCHQESLGFEPAVEPNVMVEKEYSKWHDRFKLCDKELSERVEKIFDNEA